jgi:hypothetical protein
MNLQTLQREMAATVMLPLTLDEEMQAEAPDGRSMRDVAEGFIAPNSRLSAFERLEIYNRQYWLRVLGALAEDFPALRAVVGGRAFESLSVQYLAAHPSRSFTLRNLGSKLPDWLAAHPHWAGRRHRLALDVARIEWACVETFDGADRQPLTLDDIAALGADSQLALQPHLQLLALHYPADNLVLSLHDREKRERGEAGMSQDGAFDALAMLPKIRLRATWLAVHRADLSIYYRRLKREEFQTLAALRRGLTLVESLESGFADSKVPAPLRSQRVREWFANWAKLGWLCAADPNSGL